MMKPPIVKKVKHEMVMFGDVRKDNYYWLHDDSCSNHQVLSYLKVENAYTNSVMEVDSRMRCASVLTMIIVVKLIVALVFCSLHIFSSQSGCILLLVGSPREIHLVKSDCWKARSPFSSGLVLCSSYQTVGWGKDDTKSLMNGDYSVECGDDWNLYVQKTRLHKADHLGAMGKNVDNAPHYLKGIAVLGHNEVIKTRRVNNAVADGDDMTFLCGVKGNCSDEHNPLHFELKSLDSRDEDEVIVLPVTQPSSSSALNMSPNQLGKGANDYVIGFLVLLDFVIIIGLLHYRWWKNRVQPNRQPCELNEQSKGKNHSKSKRIKNEKSENNDGTSQWKNKNNGSTSQGHIQLEDEDESIPELSLERDNDSTIQGKDKNNCSTSQGHIQLEDEECIPELSFKRNGLWGDWDSTEEFNNKMLIEEFYLTCCTIPGGHILEPEQIEKLLQLKGNVRRPPFDLLKDYLEGNGHLIGKLFVSKREIARGRNRTIIYEGIYNNVHIAVKRLVHRRNAVGLNYLRGLIELLRHPNIVHVIDIVMDDVFVYFAMERCTYNLYEFIQLCSKNMNQDNPQDRSIARIVKKLWQPNGYPSPVLVKLIRDVVAGVAHLHALRFQNLDLRPQHVLLSFEKSPCAKICDQGIIQGLGRLGSHRRPGWHSLEPLLGEYKFFAQKTWLPPQLGCEVDLFNLGCVIFFFITKGSHPFGPVRKRDANIEKNCPDLALVEHIYEAAHLISNLLRPD